MPRLHPRWAALAVGGAALADSAVASTARPFTWPANVTTAVGILLVAGCGVVALVRQRRSAALGPTSEPASSVTEPVVSLRSASPWIALVAAVTTFELVNLFAGPRHQHPTVSSLLATLTGHEVLRGLLFAVWLGAGWWLWGER